MRRLRLFLDANVLVDATARDFFCTLAELEAIDVRWSEPVLEELDRALRNRLGVPPSKASRLIATLQTAFPHAAIRDFEHLEARLLLPDPQDLHVLAAAIHSEADILVTNNVRDFPHDVLARHDVALLTTDRSIALVAHEKQTFLARAANAILARLQHPPITADEYLRLLGHRSRDGALLVGAAIGHQDSILELSRLRATAGPGSAQSAVFALMDALDSGNAAYIAERVAQVFASRLTGRATPTDSETFAAVAHHLRSVVGADDWGIASLARPLGPDRELVKLIARRGGFTVTEDQTEFPAHLFWLQLTDEGWMLYDLDGDDPERV